MKPQLLNFNYRLHMKYNSRINKIKSFYCIAWRPLSSHHRRGVGAKEEEGLSQSPQFN